MRSPEGKMAMFLGISLAFAALLGGASAQCVSKITKYPYFSNCIPFGTGALFGAYQGFVYRDVPAFELGLGSKIRFDTIGLNDYEIIVDIAIAPTTSNGGFQVASKGWTTVCTGCNAGKGNTVRDDYDLVFVTNANEFQFSGGGLALRFHPVGTFTKDSSCTGGLQLSGTTETQDGFVIRFYSDSDGEYPWTSYSTSIVGAIKIECQPTCDTTKCPCPCNSRPCKNGSCKEVTKCKGTDYLCTCKDGYYGINCDKTCTCSNHGKCIAMTGKDDYTCQCDYNKYWGKDCQTDCAAGHCDLGKDQNGVQRNVTCNATDGTGRLCALCQNGYYGPGCEQACTVGNCGGQIICAKDGTNRTCPGDYSCNAGYWGVSCDSPCVQGNCKGNVTCFKPTGDHRDCSTGGCIDGFWNADCSNQCTNPQGHCAGTVTCDQGDGSNRVCASGCADGFWGKGDGRDGSVCAKSCDQGHCVGAVKCNVQDGSGRQCTSCAAGHFGSDCKSSCTASNSHCQGNLACNQDGSNVKCTGTCLPGWYGDACNSDTNECASNPCKNGGTCVDLENAYKCKCPMGYWGSMCDKTCPVGTCSSATSVICDQGSGTILNCTQCQNGYYGSACGLSCPTSGCLGQVTCSQDGTSRQCTSCVAGRTGIDCNSFCDQGNCATTPTCNQQGGQRKCAACLAGYYKSDCTSQCPAPNCDPSGTITCQQDGTQVNCAKCKAGFYGSDCTSLCTQGNCVGAVSCDINGNNRQCTQCMDGYASATCETNCTGIQNCANTGRRRCDQNGGNLVCDACQPNWFGVDCSSNVNYCQPNPCVHGDCTDYDKQFVCKCQAGYWGVQCDQQCAQGNCSTTVTCNQTTGLMPQCDQCVSGFFGGGCTQQCPAPTCTGTVTCGKVNGDNIQCAACATGYYGPSCTEPCKAVTNCKSVTCDKVTGGLLHCDRCLNGFTGDTCGSSCQPANCGSLNDTYCTQTNASSTTCATCLPGFSLDINQKCTVCSGDGAGSATYCQNGGQCISDTHGRRTCLCTAGFTGDQCEQTDSRTNPNSQNGSGSSGMSSAATAIVIIVCIVAVGLLIFAIYSYTRKSSGSYSPQPSAKPPSAGGHEEMVMDNPLFDGEEAQDGEF